MEKVTCNCSSKKLRECDTHVRELREFYSGCILSFNLLSVNISHYLHYSGITNLSINSTDKFENLQLKICRHLNCEECYNYKGLIYYTYIYFENFTQYFHNYIGFDKSYFFCYRFLICKIFNVWISCKFISKFG